MIYTVCLGKTIQKISFKHWNEPVDRKFFANLGEVVNIYDLVFTLCSAISWILFRLFTKFFCFNQKFFGNLGEVVNIYGLVFTLCSALSWILFRLFSKFVCFNLKSIWFILFAWQNYTENKLQTLKWTGR